MFLYTVLLILSCLDKVSQKDTWSLTTFFISDKNFFFFSSLPFDLTEEGWEWFELSHFIILLQIFYSDKVF